MFFPCRHRDTKPAVTTPPTLTASTLRHLTGCARRVWLDRHADPLLRVEPPSALADNGRAHEDIISAQRYGPTTALPTASWAEAVQLTRALMRQGVRAVRGAALERSAAFNGGGPVMVRGRVDWLVRHDRHSGGWRYAPVEIKQRRTLTEADQLQLDLYLWLLEDAQGDGVSEGLFLLGEAGETLHSYDPARVLAALEQAAALCAAPQAPPVFLGKHCDLCPWQRDCTLTARAGRDIALLPGLKRETWQALRAAGILTWDDVAAQPVKTLQRLRGLGRATAETLRAYAQAFAADAPCWLGALPPELYTPGVMLDLETRLDNGAPWCFGWLEPGGVFQAAVVDAYSDPGPLALPDGLCVTIVPDSDTGWRLFADAAARHPALICHWSAFERTVLKATAPADVTGALLDRLHDLHRTFRQTCALPARGTSIKVVAGYLGLRWPESTSALTAWSDYQAWLLDGDSARLARAIAYNRVDVEALAAVQTWLAASAP
jgi:uncharacterized protein